MFGTLRFAVGRAKQLCGAVISRLSMQIHPTTFENLTKGEINAWSEIQRAEPQLASPYFRPEFTQSVATVREDVEVAVFSDGECPIGFLPFQRRAGTSVTRWGASYPTSMD